MKRLVVVFLMTVVFGHPFAARQASLTGKWQIQRNAGGNESQQECTFVQKDTDLTGSCSTERGAVEVSAGKVAGKTVTWTYKGESSAGGTVTVVYKGTVDSADSPSRITGTVTAVEYSVEGEFTATRVR